jgi:hypothetical protein
MIVRRLTGAFGRDSARTISSRRDDQHASRRSARAETISTRRDGDQLAR